MGDIPPIPPQLCGADGCSFTPHPIGTDHSWEPNAQAVDSRGLYEPDAAREEDARG